MDTQPLVSVIIPVYNVRPYLHESINSIINQWACMFSEHNHLFWFGQITLNILLFIPLGFFLPFQTPKKRISFIRILLVAFLFSVSIEMLQYITGRGITEVDDVINNTLGGVLGWCGQRVIVRKYAKGTDVGK